MTNQEQPFYNPKYSKGKPMNRKEIKSNIESYHYANIALGELYRKLDVAVEHQLAPSGDDFRYIRIFHDDKNVEFNLNDPVAMSTAANLVMEKAGELENSLFDNKPVLARAICEFIKKDYIKDFPLNLDCDSSIMYDGIENTLIELGEIAIKPSATRMRFSDKTVEIVGVGKPGEYIEFLTENLQNALKGLRVANTVNITLFGESIKLGVSGLRELVELMGPKIHFGIDRETLCLTIKDIYNGAIFTIKPWAWDRAKHKRLDPSTCFGIYDHNRKIQFTAR